MKIYPSILTDSMNIAQEQLHLSQESSEFETVQFDVIDGYFADNVTLAPTALAELDFGNTTIDLHFMVNEPMDFVFETRDVSKELPIRAILAQIERMSSQKEYVDEVKRNNWKVGISLDLYTPVESIDDDIWDDIDILQIMTVQAGFQGQEFKPQALAFVEAAAKLCAEISHPIEIIVDGGIKKEQILMLDTLGVEGVTVGSALWEANSFHDALENLQKN